MPVLFLSFLSAALAIAAGRESLRVARISAARGGAAGVWLALLSAAAVAGLLAAMLAQHLGALVGPEWHGWLVAGALTLAGIEVLLLRAPPRPREPAQSVGATMLVLFAELFTGATGLLIMAISVAAASPVLAGAGGVLGMCGALGAAAMAQDDWERLPLSAMRVAGGGLLLLAALAVALATL